MVLTVELVTEPDDLRQLFELRHEIYVSELGGVFPSSSEAGLLRESIDNVAFNYGLFEEGRVVGSLRVVDLDKFDSASLIERYQLQTLVADVGRGAVCLAGRLALRKDYRNRGHMLSLVQRAFHDARARRISYAASDCSPHLLPLYRRLGYRVQGDAFDDPLFGRKVPIVWPLEHPTPVVEGRFRPVPSSAPSP